MSVQNGKDYLYLIWKAEKSRKQYVVGQLTKNGQFEFRYDVEVQAAIEDGFSLLICFPDVEALYTDDELFSVFSCRLPDRRRKNIQEILDKYGLEEFDEYLLLKRSGARLPIDSLEFIDPIFNTEEKIKRFFYVAGVRHYSNCEGTDCTKAIEITRGDEIIFKAEKDNAYDKDAVQILDTTGRLLGYVPRYYSQGVSELLDKGKKIVGHVYNVDKRKNCNECLKVVLTTE